MIRNYRKILILKYSGSFWRRHENVLIQKESSIWRVKTIRILKVIVQESLHGFSLLKIDYLTKRKIVGVPLKTIQPLLSVMQTSLSTNHCFIFDNALHRCETWFWHSGKPEKQDIWSDDNGQLHTFSSLFISPNVFPSTSKTASQPNFYQLSKRAGLKMMYTEIFWATRGNNSTLVVIWAIVIRGEIMVILPPFFLEIELVLIQGLE